MTYVEAKFHCAVRSAIFRKSKGTRYWKNHHTPLDDRVPDEDKLATDWEEYDPRENGPAYLMLDN